MNLTHFSEAPVSVYYLAGNKKFGFLIPEPGSTEALLTGGADIFFHLNNFRMPIIEHGAVRFSKEKPTRDCIDFVATLLTKDVVLAFDLRRVEKGFAAEPWTLRSIWREQLKQLAELPVYRLSRIMTACTTAGDEEGKPEVVWQGCDPSIFKRQTSSLEVSPYTDPDGFFRVRYMWEKKELQGQWEKTPWPAQAR